MKPIPMFPALSVPSRAWALVALLAVAAAPIALSLSIPLDESGKRNLNVIPFDPLIGFAAAWLLFVRWRQGALLRACTGFARAAWPALLLLLIALASGLTADWSRPEMNKSLFLKSAVQWGEYLVLAVLVFQSLLSDPAWRARAWAVFAWSGLATAASAAWTFFFPTEAGASSLPFSIGGWLLNRNTYGLFLCVWIPVLIAYAARAPRRNARFLLLAVPPALLLCTAGGPLLGAVAGALVALSLEGKRLGRAAPLLALALLGVLLVDAPAQRLGRSAWLDSLQVYVQRDHPESGFPECLHTMRYYRWFANMEMVRRHPLTGVGLGEYEVRMKGFYSPINIPGGRTDDPAGYNITANEPLSFGWFFVTAAELGLPGLWALALLLASLLRAGLARAGAGGGSALVGAVAALALAGWFTNAMVRGGGGVVAFLLALAWSTCTPEQRSEEGDSSR